MLAKKYKSEIVSINNPFTGIYTLELKSMGRAFKYHPGQFLHLSTDANYDGIGQWPESRCFSMQSNPKEETIRITYTVKGDFTRDMEQTLKPGIELWLKLPYGNLFNQNHKKDNTVFIAGGTGVTPFLSLFTSSLFTEYNNPMLYAGFRNEKMNVYKKELQQAKQINQGFHIYTIYENKNGNLNIEKILKSCDKNTFFFISGPPDMIASFKDFILEQGIDINQLRTDDWE
jgi:predicted ferric reductase